MQARVIIALIIIIILVLATTTVPPLPWSAEFLVGRRGTRVLRTVGTLNTGDETAVAAGMVNSLPIMDMTYTYGGGISCDECPNIESCTRCPQFELTSRHGGIGSIGSNGSNGVEPLIGEMAGREYMGAVSGRVPLSRRTLGSLSMDDEGGATTNGVRNDSIFDGDRALKLGMRACHKSAEALRLLYGDVMEMAPPSSPADDDCEYRNAAGYIFKEPCHSYF